MKEETKRKGGSSGCCATQLEDPIFYEEDRALRLSDRMIVVYFDHTKMWFGCLQFADFHV